MKRGRITITIVLVLALAAAALTRDWAFRARGAIAQTGRGNAALSSRTSLSQLPSYALALLLGGLRGPLVMMLWSTSENQKNERDLEDFDTRVEWIRLLQPEFDSVHIFQIWNKAYNISVQMASLANKYTTILDALDYAESVDRERPNNINILNAIAHTYFDKLGNSTEKAYYRKRVRSETLPHASQENQDRRRPDWRKLQLDAMLDAQGNILPEKLQARYERPAMLPETGEWNAGSELQYLEQYEPFPYGISTFALAYNYHKRAQVLQSVENQKHAQQSPMVIDSRPALALKMWAEEEWEIARRLEARAFGKPAANAEDSRDMESPTASIPLDARPNDPEGELIPAALYSYQRAAEISRGARAEYERHLIDFKNNESTYVGHIEDLAAMESLVMGDHDYLAAIQATGQKRQELIDSARDHYRKAIIAYQIRLLRGYLSDEIAKAVFPEGSTKQNISELSPERYPELLAKAQNEMARLNLYDHNAALRREYETYINRAQTRLGLLNNSN